MSIQWRLTPKRQTIFVPDVAVDAATGTVVGKAVSVATDSESGQEVTAVSLAICDHYERGVFFFVFLWVFT